MPTVPKNALFAGVSGTRISVPSSDPAFSGLFFPMVTAPGQPPPACSRQADPSTRSRSSSRGTGPSAFRQSPAARPGYDGLRWPHLDGLNRPHHGLPDASVALIWPRF